ncbi:MAG: hypothetical protein K6D59_01160 [Bacteroidales bacterium]|nr:hypothetical protein [Bacteroidales bacterium]
MKQRVLILAILMGALVGCTSHHEDIDALLRSRVDALNKSSFQNRFNDAALSEEYARKAIAFIDDSLPTYADGRLRAWNNLATSFFNRSIHDSVHVYIDSILSFAGNTPNKEVEQVLAHILDARLLQRNCDIAGCYRILYYIEQSGLLDGKDDGMLFNLAKSEFYIATTTLNYHYRNKSLYQQAELVEEMEMRRSSLYCDYAEDMSLNYAIAYGYYALCSDTLRQSEYLSKALYYCGENLRLLNNSDRYSTYHLANTYQLFGFMLWSRNIKPSTWIDNAKEVKAICDYVRNAFSFDVSDVADTTLAFMREATSLFFLHDDPYQRLGAVVATGRYCMAVGDTALACDYFVEGLDIIDRELPVQTDMGRGSAEGSIQHYVAPKFEAMLYEGLLVSGCAISSDQVRNWTRKELDLLYYIKQNEKADFLLQRQLEEANRGSATMLRFTLLFAVLAVALLVTLLLLRRRTKALQKETAMLQEAKRKDVERIANVETCLSVLRHDITPFVSYLQNENLPDPLKREVTGQLIRTFENIKNWTNLSIPSGLQFRLSTVAVQEVFDSVQQSVNNPYPDAVALRFQTNACVASGDRQLLEIMLRNLVNNALQHTENGSVSVGVEPWADDKRFLHFSVADTGSGMNPDDLENLFRSDKKPRQAGQQGYGSGFGLILCRYIIKKHDDNTIRGCRIWAESTAGKGSIFHFLIAAKED